MYDKEKIYDEQIYPLMDQIVKICKNNDVQMIFSCYLKTDEEGDLRCTTYLKSEEENCQTIDDAAKVVQLGYIAEKPYYSAITIDSRKE
jgi:hypothetical protein